MKFSATQPDPAQDQRLAALLRQAPLEFARVVYGLNDRASGRAGTMAAEDVARTERQGVPVTRERAEQRARAYLPAGRPGALPALLGLQRRQEPAALPRGDRERPETASCKVCGAEYASSLD